MGPGQRPAGARSIDELLAQVRRRIDRVAPEEVAARQAAGALLVDTRPWEQRTRDGHVPGAVLVDRNVLEWRLDPASPDRIPQMTGYDVDVIVLCNEGYSSSLVADTLRSLGLASAVDVIGGFVAWAAAGLPVISPDALRDAAA
jgi:rhodanese-related sulfurtransferase